ncbi:MAG: DoxX family protein [Planctomycetota bacterium]
MNRLIPNIAGALYGLLFIAFAVMFLTGNMPEDPNPPAEGSPAALFMGAMFPTGYLKLVKVLELLGGLLVAIPRTRNYGLLILVPIVVNIVAFHMLVRQDGIMNPILLVVIALTAFLLFAERKAIAGLAHRN